MKDKVEDRISKGISLGITALFMAASIYVQFDVKEMQSTPTATPEAIASRKNDAAFLVVASLGSFLGYRKKTRPELKND